MNEREYKAEIEALKQRIAELERTEIKSLVPPHPRWKPERKKPYYTINLGCACAGLTTWESDNLDGEIYSLGFVFKTEADAEFAVERLKVLAEMREWAGKWNDQYTITINHFDLTLEVLNRGMLRANGEMRFATEEDAEGCIKTVGADRIKKYYFMISEDEA